MCNQESPSTAATKVVLEPATRGVDALKKQGAAVRRPDYPEVVRDAISMVDLAISRCRAGRYSENDAREQVLGVLRAARQELRQISEGQDPATVQPVSAVDTTRAVRPGKKRLVRNGHAPNSD